MGDQETSDGHGKVMRIVVAGDVVIDNHLIKGRNLTSGPRWEKFIKTCSELGGAELVANLIKAIASNLQENGTGEFEVHQTEASSAQIAPNDTRFLHDYVLWDAVKDKIKDKDGEKERKVWRVQEGMGYSYDPPLIETPVIWPVAEDIPDADLVVLDDADFGFRTSQDKWPAALATTGSQPWVLIKCAQPFKDASGANAATWEQLLKDHGERMILVISANELRRADVQISQELSWERTAQDLFWELLYNLHITELAMCAHVIITFGASGAFLMSRQQKNAPACDQEDGNGNPGLECTLVYDPAVIENTWEQELSGSMFGISTTIVCGIARQIMMDAGCPNILAGLKSGLVAARKLFKDGYGVPNKVDSDACVLFPAEMIAKEYDRQEDTFYDIKVEKPSIGVDRPLWTILEQRFKERSLRTVAESIVLDGVEKTLKGVPLGRFEKFMTVDRNEIESFRSIRILVNEYLRQPDQKNPLNIAVFGPPGSGKSFGVTQVVKSLLKDQIDKVDVNMSQLGTVEDLYKSLHRVRDVGLQGKVPVVFWDEFDSKLGEHDFGWLKYFLMPMQDGKFIENETTHPIGKAIFVFAGGVCENFRELEEKKDKDEFKKAKIPDFISRLRGVVQIFGPNEVILPKDPYYIIRRATVLRSQFETLTPQFIGPDRRMKIDYGVLRAFLQIKSYKHGIRSMESLIMMSALSSKAKFERSSLPPDSQLELHVNAKEFIALVQQLEFEGEILEKIAKKNHELYCAAQQAKWPKGGAKLKPRWLMTWDELPEDDKEQNRDAVRDIPRKLGESGFAMIRERDNLQPAQFTDEEIESMAKLEHDRWTKMKIRNGWKYGPKRNDAKKEHPSIVPWAASDLDVSFTSDEKRAMEAYENGEPVVLELSDDERLKDREFIANIPTLIEGAGYVVVRLGN